MMMNMMVFIFDDDDENDDDDALEGFAVKRLEAVPSECKQIALSPCVCTEAVLCGVLH